jgi:hypothetical protein
MADLADLGLDWAIEQAKDGQREILAKQIEHWEGSMPPKLLQFLAGVVSGDIKLKRPKKTPYLIRRLRNSPERNVVFMVDAQMKKLGKQRDKHLRTALTRKWSEYFGTNEDRVASYRKHRDRPRRA